jgi:anaerobic sulfite reductase subunit B
VTKLLPAIDADPANAIAMMCGPDLMMHFTAIALADRGFPAEQVWVSLERSMKCAVGHCGHCQLGPLFVCKDGPVVRHDTVAALTAVREL